MDGRRLFPEGFNARYPWAKPSSLGDARHQSRTSVGRIKYFYIDFGLSTYHGPGSPKVALGTFGRDRDAPELSNTIPYDPFKLDVRILGNVFKELLEVGLTLIHLPRSVFQLVVTSAERGFRVCASSGGGYDAEQSPKTTYS
jgi:hypothetical protein